MKGPQKPMAVVLPTSHREREHQERSRGGRETKSGAGGLGQLPLWGVLWGWQRIWGGWEQEGMGGGKQIRNFNIWGKGGGRLSCALFSYPIASVCKGKRKRGIKNSSCIEQSFQIKGSRGQIRIKNRTNKTNKQIKKPRIAAASSSPIC